MVMMMADFGSLAPEDIDPWLVAAIRQRRAVQPPGGRQGNPEQISPAIRAGAVSALDPFGLPSAAIGQISPDVRDAIRAQYEGYPVASTMGAMTTPLPLGGIVRAAGEAIRAAPKAVAGALGAFGALAPEEVESGGLTQTQLQRQREQAAIERQRMRDQSMARKDELEAKKLEAANALKTERERHEQQQRIEGELAAEAKRKAEAPFSERHPGWTAAMTPLALGAAAALPLLRRAGQLGSQALAKRGWEEIADETSHLLRRNPDSPRGQQLLHELQARQGEWAGATARTPVKDATTVGTGGLVSAEVLALPDEIDAANLQRGSPSQVAAARRINPLDPESAWAGRLLAGGLGGVTAAGMGTKLAHAIPNLGAPTAQSAGVLGRFGPPVPRIPGSATPQGSMLPPPQEPMLPSAGSAQSGAATMPLAGPASPVPPGGLQSSQTYPSLALPPMASNLPPPRMIDPTGQIVNRDAAGMWRRENGQFAPTPDSDYVPFGLSPL